MTNYWTNTLTTILNIFNGVIECDTLWISFYNNNIVQYQLIWNKNTDRQYVKLLRVARTSCGYIAVRNLQARRIVWGKYLTIASHEPAALCLADRLNLAIHNILLTRLVATPTETRVKFALEKLIVMSRLTQSHVRHTSCVNHLRELYFKVGKHTCQCLMAHKTWLLLPSTNIYGHSRMMYSFFKDSSTITDAQWLNSIQLQFL